MVGPAVYLIPLYPMSLRIGAFILVITAHRPLCCPITRWNMVCRSRALASVLQGRLNPLVSVCLTPVLQRAQSLGRFG